MSGRLNAGMAQTRAVWLTCVVLLAGAPALGAQGSTQSQPPARTLPAQAPPQAQPPQTPRADGASQATATTTLPVDLDRIREALLNGQTAQLDEPHLRFYLDILAKHPTFKQFIGSADLLHGAVPGAPMDHQEFLDMVTPREFNHPMGVNVLAATKKVADALRRSRSDADVQAIRAEIDRELAALRGGG